jgi:hypothetical protein
MTTMIDPQKGNVPTGLPGAEQVLFQQAVPRHLVHRISNTEVFVTGLRVTGFNSFEVAARWPASHGFYGPAAGETHDPVLLLECLRQAGLLIAHVAFAVPADHMFVTHEKTFEVDPAGLRTDGAQPVDVTIDVTAHDVRKRGKGFAGMLFEYRCLRGGVEIATASIRWSCVSAAGYARLRGRYLRAEPLAFDGSGPVPPEPVGRCDSVDVVLAEEPDRPGWVLRLDPSHPVIFDHPIDHAPGMALVEAARQAARLTIGAPGALPVGGTLSFRHYVEFETPCHVSAEVEQDPENGTTTRVRVLFEQDGHVAAEARLEMLVAG